MPYRDITIIAGWLMWGAGSVLALGTGYGLMIAGALTIVLGMFALREAK